MQLGQENRQKQARGNCQSENWGILNGIRVADFTWVGAGPYMTKMLADQGAEVIRIESGIRPDVLRTLPPFAGKKAGLNRSGYFSNRNTNKKSICLDLSQGEAREVARMIIEKADIVANSFTPGVMEKWGFSYEEVRQINPEIIYVSMPMQGSSGPHKDYMGFGATMNALIGFNHLTGLPEREPIGSGTNYPDHVPNPTHTLFAVLAALRYRYKTGQGQAIEVSQVESALATLAVPLMDYLNNGVNQTRKGNRDERYAPQGVYPCQGEERWIAISIRSDEEWVQLCQLMEREDLLVELQYATHKQRLENHQKLDQLLSDWTSLHSAESLMLSLQEHGIAAGVVQNAQDVVEKDPQLQARKHWIYLEHEEMGRSIYQNSPYKLSKTPSILKKGAPLLGEHTEEICLQLLNMSQEEYQALQDKGIFR